MTWEPDDATWEHYASPNRGKGLESGEKMNESYGGDDMPEYQDPHFNDSRSLYNAKIEANREACRIAGEQLQKWLETDGLCGEDAVPSEVFEALERLAFSLSWKAKVGMNLDDF